MEDLTKLIDKMVEDKTSSLDAIGAVNALRETADELQKHLDSSGRSVEILKREKASLESHLRRALDAVEVWEGREAALQEAEGKCHANETARQVAEAKANTAMEMFKTVFKPAEVRRSVFGTVPDMNPTAYSGATINTAREEVEVQE